MKKLLASTLCVASILFAPSVRGQPELPRARNFVQPDAAPQSVASPTIPLGTTWSRVVHAALAAIERLDAQMRVAATTPLARSSTNTRLLTLPEPTSVSTAPDTLGIERGPIATGPAPLTPVVPVAGDERDPKGVVLGARVAIAP